MLCRYMYMYLFKAALGSHCGQFSYCSVGICNQTTFAFVAVANNGWFISSLLSLVLRSYKLLLTVRARAARIDVCERP
jgi:hypothetical protein